MYRLYAAKYTWEEVVAEVKKCRIMCHNCHMEDTHSVNDRRYDPDNHVTLDILIEKLIELDQIRSNENDKTD